MTERERRELIKDIQSVVADKMILETPAWIMESPDGGKTVSKRKFGEKEKFYLNNVNGKWYNYEEALEAARQRDREEDLRQQHPGLREAWEVYRTMLAIIDPNISKDPSDKA
jgi:hypothetical protein